MPGMHCPVGPSDHFNPNAVSRTARSRGDLPAGPAACADVAWPAVENVTILGHPRASIGKVELVTSSPSGLLGAADVTPDQVWRPLKL